MSELPVHTTVDDVHAHPRHVGHRWIDLMLALTAVFISGVSLYVAVEHGRTERKLVDANAQLVQANSWPFLQIERSYSNSGDAHLELTNAGIGPAKLVSLEVLYKGQPVRNLYTLLQQCCGLGTTPEQRHVQAPHGLAITNASDGVLRPGETRTVIQVPGSPEQHAVADRFLAEAGSITFRACYCSVFDQCWMSKLEGLRPKLIAACPDGVRSFNDGTV